MPQITQLNHNLEETPSSTRVSTRFAAARVVRVRILRSFRFRVRSSIPAWPTLSIHSCPSQHAPQACSLLGRVDHFRYIYPRSRTRSNHLMFIPRDHGGGCLLLGHLIMARSVLRFPSKRMPCLAEGPHVPFQCQSRNNITR